MHNRDMADGRAWIAEMGPKLAVQARLLRGLLAAVESDPRWEWLELGCSVAAGRGDALSDLDLALGHVGDAAPPFVDVTSMLTGLGEVIDVSAQPWEGTPRWWVQYADGGQIDLIMLPGAGRPGHAPGSVVLFDRHDRLGLSFTPRVLSAAPEEPRQWMLAGWEALSNAGKYLRRDSLFEAIEQLHQARGRILQLWAVGERVTYPAFGLTSLLDDPAARVPDGLAGTYAVPERASVLAAALAAAELLRAAASHAQQGLTTPLTEYVTANLRSVE